MNKASLAIRNVLNFPNVMGALQIENLQVLTDLANKMRGDAVAAGQPDADDGSAGEHRSESLNLKGKSPGLSRGKDDNRGMANLCAVETTELVEKAYAAFNGRDVEGALALMTEDVRWPKASEGGVVVGKEEIRGYWARQWGEFDPRVEPVAMSEVDGGVRVRVHQVVRSLSGEVLADGEVVHVFTVREGLIAAMVLGEDIGAGPAAAFAHRA